MICTVLAIAALALDQLSKYLTVRNLAPGQDLAFWPGVLHFTHVRNEGMSFSLLSGARWFFVVVTLAVIALAIFAMYKKWISHPFGLISLSCVLGGAVGNLIDRVRWGYVVDMIEVEFVRFAVFNVADMFVVCGGIAFCIYGIFFWKEPEKRGASDHETDA